MNIRLNWENSGKNSLRKKKKNPIFIETINSLTKGSRKV